MDIEPKRLALLIAIVTGVVAVILWTGSLSVDGVDCGSAASPASGTPADCVGLVQDRREWAWVASTVAVGALWFALKRDAKPDDPD